MPVLEESIDSNYVQTATREVLAIRKIELACLRYWIILGARWESSDSLEHGRRVQLREDLVHLRRHYFEKIDEIAMKIGIQAAMKTQADVEKNVIVPRGAKLPDMAHEELGYGI